MKILYLPLLVPGGANEQYDLMEAFKRAIGSHSFRTFDYFTFQGEPNRELIRLFSQFNPDILHMQLQETDKIKPYAVQVCKRKRPKCIITQWSGDVRNYAMDNMVQVGKFVDYTMISNTGQIPFYESKIGRKCYYWQNAIGPRFYTEPAPLEERWGIAFVGNNYGDRFPQSSQRIELVKALRKNFGDQFRHFGGGWGEETKQLPWDKQIPFYRTSLVTVSQNHTVTDRYFSDRTLIMMCSGGIPHVLHYSPGVEIDFKDEADCLYWKTVPEAIEKIRWFLDHPKEAEKIGLKGYQKIQKNHNWDVRVKEYQEIIGVEFPYPEAGGPHGKAASRSMSPRIKALRSRRGATR